MLAPDVERLLQRADQRRKVGKRLRFALVVLALAFVFAVGGASFDQGAGVVVSAVPAFYGVLYAAAWIEERRAASAHSKRVAAQTGGTTDGA